MDKLASGAGTLASGARQTADGAAALADGTSQAADGIDQLTGAMRQAEGAAALVEAQADGLATDGVALTDKADALANGLRTSADGTGSYETETRTRIGALAADPVGLEASRANAVGGPADGLAPFLMAIAIWLGALGAFLVLPGLWRSEDPRWWRSVLVAYAGAAAVAVAGALLMVAGLTFLVGVEVARMPELLGFAALAALAFTAIVQALVALFGSRGWLAALLFLVVQVAASGVLLSAATLPGPLAVLHPFVTLTYAIDAFRGAITGGASATALNAAVLVAWLVAAVLVTLAVAAGASMRKEADAAAVT
jgi:putative membrane protein